MTLPWKIFSNGLSRYATASWCAVKPLSMKSRRFRRIASRPCQSATPRLHTAFSAKQSKHLPKVFSSISFHISSSHVGGAILVKVCVVMFLSCVVVDGYQGILAVELHVCDMSPAALLPAQPASLKTR